MGTSADAVLWMVDDNPADLEITSIVCEQINFPGRFLPLADGLAFMKKLDQVWEVPLERPDVVLLDLNMPSVSGMAVLRMLRRDPRWRTLPVVMFSTSQSPEEMEAVGKEGATEYVLKPSLLADTVITIRGVIGRYCKSRELEIDTASRP